MLKEIINKFHKHPLSYILLAGFLIRLLASIFSKGFLTLDDHFNFVVDADMIASGEGLPKDYKDSPLYPFIGALIMIIGRALGNKSPDIEMFTIRCLQGLLSLLVIYFVYKILELKINKSSAIFGGLLAATFFVIPITAVHQFEEAICQIPLLASIWIVLKHERERLKNTLPIFMAGILMGIAFILRFPMLSFVAVFALGLFFQQSTRKYFIPFFVGIILISVAQAILNIYINGDFGYSFKRNFGWIFANPSDLFHTSGYPAGPPWRYILTLLGIFIPPFSILFFIAAIRGGKVFPLMGISVLCFFLAHSIIANKQERFLLPIIPLLIILSVSGFYYLKIWFALKNLTKLYRIGWLFFWVLNTLLLAFTTFHYGKKDRVEPFVYIQKQHNAVGIIIAQYNYEFLVPEYYLGKPLPLVYVFKDRNNFQQDIERLSELKSAINYLVLYSDSIDTDKENFEQALGKKFQLIKESSPSLGDWIAHLFNPKYNRINTARVFRLF